MVRGVRGEVGDFAIVIIDFTNLSIKYLYVLAENIGFV